MKVEWKDTGHNIQTDVDDNSYISFLKPDETPGGICSWAADDPRAGETALITRKPWKCLILNGNHLPQYEAILLKGEGYAGCLEYFRATTGKSSWTDCE